jgi:putative transposase
MYAMARKPRIHYPGAVYHAMLRGNAKQAVFQSDEDYSRFEDILAQGMDQSAAGSDPGKSLFL